MPTFLLTLITHQTWFYEFFDLAKSLECFAKEKVFGRNGNFEIAVKMIFPFQRVKLVINLNNVLFPSNIYETGEDKRHFMINRKDRKTNKIKKGKNMNKKELNLE